MNDVAMKEPMDILEVEPGVYSVLRDGHSIEARVDGATVTIEGRVYPVEVNDPRKWNPGAAGVQAQGRESVRAPMPGKILRVLVEVGQEVSAGQGVVVMEAMKMQNELKTSKGGRVTSVSAAENETVVAGTVLATVELA